jgi:hypothetical protein
MERGAALTSRLQSFEAELLTQAENLASLARINRELISRAQAIAPRRQVVLDLYSTEVPVYGEQEARADNGHFEAVSPEFSEFVSVILILATQASLGL